MLGLAGLGLLLAGLWAGLGGDAFFLCAVGLILIAVDDHRRRPRF